jgi:DNA-binding NarL/FixJ family response regulator
VVPDVVVLDLSLSDGSTPTSNIHAVQAVGAHVLIHSIADRVALVREALAAGASGVIPKSSPTDTVIAAIATVAETPAVEAAPVVVDEAQAAPKPDEPPASA